MAAFGFGAAEAQEPDCRQLLDAMRAPEKALLFRDADSCDTARGLAGSNEWYCVWAYPYRSAEARAAFTAISSTASACLTTVAPDGADQRVNHPDSYELQQYRDNAGSGLSLALKDKAGMDQTLLFMRVSRP